MRSTKNEKLQKENKDEPEGESNTQNENEKYKKAKHCVSDAKPHAQ
jgi:hypothetical protein